MKFVHLTGNNNKNGTLYIKKPTNTPQIFKLYDLAYILFSNLVCQKKEN